jgi:hypothetical protein
VTDALGGADGVLGTDGMSERRILVDFRNDQIIIMRSHNARAAAGFRTIPFQLIRGNLVAVAATVGGIRTTAIIDTGGQVTIANLALRRALEPRWSHLKTQPDQIMGVTTDVQEGDAARTPPLLMGGRVDQGGVVEIHYARRDLRQHAYIRALASHRRAGNADRHGCAGTARHADHRLPQARTADSDARRGLASAADPRSASVRLLERRYQISHRIDDQICAGAEQ